MLDVCHALLADGLDLDGRAQLDDKLEPAGHEVRASVDPAYKRATWGRRPEDVAAQQSVAADMAGRRTR